MKIEAISTVIAFDGAMVVLNPGDIGELSDDLAEQEIAAGKAKAVKGSSKNAEQEIAAGKAAPAADSAP